MCKAVNLLGSSIFTSTPFLANSSTTFLLPSFDALDY